MADNTSRTGSRVGNDVAEWTHDLHVPHDAALARAYATPDGVPAIMVGRSDGKTVNLLLKMIGAKKVVEVGTLVGYSTIHIARALPADGHVWSVEYEARHAEIARDNLTAAGLADRVTVLHGAGLDVLPKLNSHGPFDAVFIDADKDNYAHYGQWAVANLRRGGLVLGDNAYLFGELLADSPRGKAMRAFHQHVAATCDSVCIPTPDGLVVGIKR